LFLRPVAKRPKYELSAVIVFFLFFIMIQRRLTEYCTERREPSGTKRIAEEKELSDTFFLKTDVFDQNCYVKNHTYAKNCRKEH